MLNKIFVMGRLTRDPELRRTNNGTAVASFALAVDRDFKNADGSKDTDFIDIVAWRGTAEFASKYFTKGRMAVVEGRLQMRDWQDKNGNNRRSAEIVADNMYFGDSRKDTDAQGTFPGRTSRASSWRWTRMTAICRSKGGDVNGQDAGGDQGIAAAEHAFAERGTAAEAAPVRVGRCRAGLQEGHHGALCGLCHYLRRETGGLRHAVGLASGGTR